MRYAMGKAVGIGMGLYMEQEAQLFFKAVGIGMGLYMEQEA